MAKEKLKKYHILEKKYQDLLKHYRALQTDYESIVVSEQRLMQLFQFAPEAYYLNDLRGNFIDGNNAASKLLGYDKHELIGRNFLKIKLLSRDQLAKAAANLSKNALGKPTGPDEFILKDKNGNDVYVEVITQPIKINGKRIVMGVARDISQRKRFENELNAQREQLEKMVDDRTRELRKTNQELTREITERKSHENALKESERRYRDLVENANIAILIDNKDGSFHFFNKKFADFFGYSMQEMQKQNVNKLIHPDDLDRVLNYHKRRAQGKRTRNRYEFHGIRQDGSSIYVEVHAAPVKRSGKVYGTRSFMWDITERKLAEFAREKSERKYRKLFDNMRDGSVISTQNGDILDCNRAFLNLTGYKSREIRNINWYDLSTGDVTNQEQKIIADEVLQKKYSKLYEKYLHDKSGKKIPVELRAYMIENESDEEPYIWFIVRDITRRKQIENEMLMLAQSVRSVRECVCVTDMEENILYVNDAFIKTYGFKREELIGQHIGIVKTGSDEAPVYQYTLAGGWKGEVINRRKDGSTFPVSLSTSLITDEQHNPVALVGVANDISQSKEFEEKFRQVQKMEAVGQLAGGIAHDFNNILTAINGYAELAIMKMKSKNPLFKEITGILKAGKRASGLVRQLLAFSRQQMIEPKILEVNHLIVDLDRMLRRLIGEDINVNIKLDDNLGNIKADAGQLEQILVNLVVNARDAINQKTSIAGEKKITIETSNTYIDKEYVKEHPGSREGMHVCITISDTGIGMKKEVQSKVFEPFFTTKDKIKGTGLGLATVYGIVKQNNGYIYLYSEVNKGTTVRIHWPMVTQIRAEKPKSTNAYKVPGGRETILFVEDNDEVRKFTVSALNTLGYKVLSATQGREAIQMIQQDTLHIDLIITDVIMPEMGGKEMAEKILHISPSAKILFTSGYTDNHIVHSGTLDEDVHFIHKPYSIEGLANKVRIVLDS